MGSRGRGAGRKGTQRIVHAGEVPAPPVVAALLSVEPESPVIVRRRIIELDGTPNELTDTYYPAPVARDTALASTDKIRGGAVSLLARLGHVGALVREDVTADIPSPEECQQLGTEPGVPVLRIHRVTLDAQGEPIQADVIAMPAHRQRLRYELRIG